MVIQQNKLEKMKQLCPNQKSGKNAYIKEELGPETYIMFKCACSLHFMVTVGINQFNYELEGKNLF